jgi:hypothetical protein
MNDEIALLQTLKRILLGVEEGQGTSNALVANTACNGSLNSVAREALLGYPPTVSMRSLVDSKIPEVGMLASLIVIGSKGSVMQIGRRGGGLSLRLENMVKARESIRMEARVYNLRSLMIAGVLGAVMGMISTVGPVFGSLNIGSPIRVDPLLIQVTAGAMVSVSAAMLGVFMSGRRFPIHVLLALTAFIMVVLVSSPLTNGIFSSSLGIK